jgi:HD-like signal output (HDOD) protein
LLSPLFSAVSRLFMAEKSILVAQAKLLMAGELKTAFGESWNVTVAANGPAALAAVENQSFNALVADVELFGAGGAGFREFLQKTGPQTVQFVMATEAERVRVLKDAPGQRLFIGRQSNATALKSLIDRALGLDIWMANEDVRRLVSGMGAFPAMPPLLLELEDALATPKVTAKQIGDIIATDAAVTAKLLEVFNTAGFGGSRQVTDLNKAAGILGFELAKWLVAAIALINEFDRVKPAYFSIDQLWRRGTAVAGMAREIALRHTADAALANAAFAAGLLHDVGTVVLACAFDEQYQAVLMVANEQQEPVWQVEKNNFGASHGEVGAYALSLWGMPLDMLEAVALHDHPSGGLKPGFTPLTAVHIAQVWEHEMESDGFPGPKISGSYLDDVGIFDRLSDWRKSMALPAAHPPTPPGAHQPSTQNPPTMPPKPPVLEQVSSGAKWPWVAAATGGLVLLGVLAYGPITRVAAKFEDQPKGDAAAGSKADSSTAGAEEKPRQPAILQATTNAVVNNAPPQAQGEIVFPELKLSGIFFSSESPSAIINGQLVHTNENVSGVHVLEIGRSRVTVEYQQHKKTLSL